MTESKESRPTARRPAQTGPRTTKAGTTAIHDLAAAAAAAHQSMPLCMNIGANGRAADTKQCECAAHDKGNGNSTVRR